MSQATESTTKPAAIAVQHTSSVLFDAPGPKAAARYRLMGYAGAVLLVLALAAVLRQFYVKGQLDPALWTPFVTDPEVWTEYLLPGIWATIKAAVLSVTFAAIFGVVFGLGRLWESAPIRWIAGICVEFFRAVPVLIMMLFLGYGLLPALGIVPMRSIPLVAVVMALTLYNGSVLAELVRSGVKALPAGQRQAALAVGMTPAKSLRLIELPQAVRNMLPAAVSQFVVILKDSALGFAILYQELLTWAKTLGSAYSNIVAAYLVAALIFILLNIALTRFATWLEGRLRTSGA